MKDQQQPIFETYATATLNRVTATFGQRGTEYGDTLKDCQWLKMKAVARELGITIPDDKFRVLAIAGFCDIKYQRNQGGYKEDSIIDGIAYDAVLAEEMKRLATPSITGLKVTISDNPQTIRTWPVVPYISNPQPDHTNIGM